MALNRLHEGLLPKRAGPQLAAIHLGGQHGGDLLSLRFALTGVEGVQGVLQIHLPDGLTPFPEGAQQLNQPADPLNTATASIEMEIGASEHKATACELFKAAKIGLPAPRKRKGRLD
jgi:hypothetical protein